MTKSELATILPYSYETLLDKVSQKLKPKRYEHVLRVAETAEALANKYGADPVKARIAGIVHDYAKQFPDEAFRSAIVSQKLDPELLAYNNGIWHGVVGTYFIQRDLGIYDPEILSAVEKHTIAASKMSTLDQIIFVADFIEPGRDFSGVQEAREVAKHSLKDAVIFELKSTLSFLITHDQKIYPKTITSYNAWINS